MVSVTVTLREEIVGKGCVSTALYMPGEEQVLCAVRELQPSAVHTVELQR